MGFKRLPLTAKREYDAIINAGLWGFRLNKETEKERACLQIKTGRFDTNVMLNADHIKALQVLLGDYLNHLGGKV